MWSRGIPSTCSMWCVLCRVSYQYFQVTMLTHFLTLCKKLRGNSALVIETNHHCLCLVLWHAGDADACFGHKPVLTSTGFHLHFCLTVHLTWCYCVASATFCHSCGRMKTWLFKHSHCFSSEAIFASAAHKMKSLMCQCMAAYLLCASYSNQHLCGHTGNLSHLVYDF